MTARFYLARIPRPQVEGDDAPWRTVDDNFLALRTLLERAIASGDLIADGVVTEDMLTAAAKTLVGDVTGTIGASGATVVALGGDASGTSGAAVIDLDALLDSKIGSTRGSVLYRGASGWAILVPGTAGYLLETAGAGADPSWVAPPSAGASYVSTGTTGWVWVGGFPLEIA